MLINSFFVFISLQKDPEHYLLFYLLNAHGLKDSCAFNSLLEKHIIISYNPPPTHPKKGLQFQMIYCIQLYITFNILLFEKFSLLILVIHEFYQTQSFVLSITINYIIFFTASYYWILGRDTSRSPAFAKGSQRKSKGVFTECNFSHACSITFQAAHKVLFLGVGVPFVY